MAVREVKIRRVEPHEWERLRGLRLRAHADSPDAFLETLTVAAALSDETWQGRVQKSPDRIQLVAEDDDGRWVGMAEGHRVDSDRDVVQVVGVWAAPDARRQGVGAAVTLAVTQWAREVGAAACRLETAADNESARRMYRRLGFVDTDERPSAIPGDRVQRLALR
jgi:ribosomal protein S18 acetylase RimI-like enzyme